MNYLIAIGVLFVAGVAEAQSGAVIPAEVQAQIAALLSKYQEVIVPTTKGYDVKLLRANNNSGSGSGLPVLISHGLLTNALDWIIPGDRSLPFMLAAAGYDVWLLGARQSSTPQQDNFSFQEMGAVDLPAAINHVLTATGKSQLHFIGHSDGTTCFFAMAATKPEMNAKIRTMQALAPLAFVSRATSPLLTLTSDILGPILDLLGLGGDLKPTYDSMIQDVKSRCLSESQFPVLCDDPVFLLGGYNSENLNSTLIPLVVANAPTTYVKEIAHYAQLLKSGKFRQFDYGLVGNLLAYGSLSPPSYNLNAVTASVALHYSDNDWLSSVQDVDELASKLGNLIGKFRVPDPKFSHLDYLFGNDADTLLYNRVIVIMDRY